MSSPYLLVLSLCDSQLIFSFSGDLSIFSLLLCLSRYLTVYHLISLQIISTPYCSTLCLVIISVSSQGSHSQYVFLISFSILSIAISRSLSTASSRTLQHCSQPLLIVCKITMPVSGCLVIKKPLSQGYLSFLLGLVDCRSTKSKHLSRSLRVACLSYCAAYPTCLNFYAVSLQSQAWESQVVYHLLCDMQSLSLNRLVTYRRSFAICRWLSRISFVSVGYPSRTLSRSSRANLAVGASRLRRTASRDTLKDLSQLAICRWLSKAAASQRDLVGTRETAISL